MKAWYNFGLVAIVTFFSFLQLRAQPRDRVAGNLILFQENGGWCWYQDERVLVDTAAGSVIFHAIQNYAGVGGRPVDGNIMIGGLDLESRNRSAFLLARLPSYNTGDDHNVGALWQRPDGRYFAAYAGHNDKEDAARMRISSQPHDVTSWGKEFRFNWTEAGGKDGNVTYNNVHFLADEGSGKGRLYNITRQWERSPIIGYSDDWGETWNYGGALSLPVSGRGYSNGYYKYTSNGADRIDFIATEAHPRDFNTNIYHGYIQAGRSHNSQGTVIDPDVFDQNAPDPQEFTAVFTSSPEDKVNDDSEYHRAWTVDLEGDAAGNIYGLFTTRYGTKKSSNASGDADHRLFYAKLDKTQGTWTYTELCKMGIPLDPREQDYTGLGAIDPDNPNIVYVSTPVNPSTDASTPRWEIYRGESRDGGKTWSWTAITRNSSVDNLRPIVPAWDVDNTAVLWLRGEYVWQHEHDQSVVGLIERDGESAGPMTYVDASASNTSEVNGEALNATGPGSDMGGDDQRWHWRSGFGNGGSVLTSAESGGENAPALRTRISPPRAGTYDVWVNFWADPDEDWRIRAGFSADELLLFRHKASQQVENGAHDSPITLTGSDVSLYQAYLGRVGNLAGGSIDVYVDDYAVEVGTASTLAGNTLRTWYDGVSFARADPATSAIRSSKKVNDVLFNQFAGAVTLDVGAAGIYSLSIFDLEGSYIGSLFKGHLGAGPQSIRLNSGPLSKGIYIIRLENIASNSEKRVIEKHRMVIR